MAIPKAVKDYAGVGAFDTEYLARPGEPYEGVAFAYHNMRTDTGQVHMYDELPTLSAPPYLNGHQPSLTFVYQGTAEGGFCHAMGLPLPEYPIDLMVEAARILNVCVGGRDLRDLRKAFGGRYDYANRVLGLLTVCDLYGLPPLMSEDDKEEGRGWVMAGWESIRAHYDGIRQYAAKDALTTARLAEKMLPMIDNIPQAVNRGRYSMAYGRILQRGLPFDQKRFSIMQNYWELFRKTLIDEVDPERFVLSDTGQFTVAGFDTLIHRLGLESLWPRTRTGRFKTDKNTLRDYCDLHPILDRIAELRQTLSAFRVSAETGTLFGFALGADGRLRHDILSPMGTHTGRVRPLGNGNPLVCPKWVRGFIRSEKGYLLVADWTAQEIMIAAGLSGDVRMQEWYAKDVYLEIAKSLGLAPSGATKSTHREVRDVFKTVVLGALYGRGYMSIAKELGIPQWKAKRFLSAFDRLFPDVRRLQRHISHEARMKGHIRTCDGWQGAVVPRWTKPTTLYNWYIQAHGAAILRCAVTLLDRQDISLIATLHDSLLVECSESDLSYYQKTVETDMRYAGELVCGHPIDVDMKILSPGERYLEEGKPRDTWVRIWGKMKKQGVRVSEE